MRKELFKHEITLLRDTFGRLLRRHAETNLIKLIKKTHPADLAIVFRYFNDDEQMQVFNLMNSSNHTLEFLIELDDTIIEKLLNNDWKIERISAVDKAILFAGIIELNLNNDLTNNIIISPTTDGQTIDGQASIRLESPYASVQIYTDGVSKYYIF